MSMTLYYTFGVGTPDAMRVALAKLDKSDYLACIVPPYKFVKKVPVGSEKEMKPILSNPQLVVVGGESEDQIVACMQQRLLMFPLMEKCEYLEMGNEFMATFKVDEFKAMVEAALIRTVSMTAMLFNTAQHSIRNYFANAYETFIYQDWKGTASRVVRPLIVVGMGPSMAGEIDTLKKLRGRVHILATDNSLRYLMRNGIRPDFVSQVEWSPRTGDFYAGCGITKETAPTLIALAGIYPDVIQTWPGPILSFTNHQMAMAFTRFYGNNTPPFFGSNVGTFSLQVAEVLQPPEVWLVGFDFGAPCYLYFHPGCINMEGEVYTTMTRHWSPLKMDYLHNRRRHDAVEVLDREGKTMVTSSHFESDRRLIERMISGSKMPFFNCSRHGREIGGATYRPLSDLCASVPYSKVPMAYAEKTPLDNDGLRASCIEMLGQLREYKKLQGDVFKTAVEGLALVENGHPAPMAMAAFGTAVDALQARPIGWVENFMSTLEPELRHVFVMETIRSREYEKKSEKLKHWASIVRDYYPNTERFLAFIEEFLNMLIKKSVVTR